MTLQMFGRRWLTGKNVERHLIEFCEALLGEQHLDGTHVSGAVEPPQGKVGHECISHRLRTVQLITSNGRVTRSALATELLTRSSCVPRYRDALEPSAMVRLCVYWRGQASCIGQMTEPLRDLLSVAAARSG